MAINLGREEVFPLVYHSDIQVLLRVGTNIKKNLNIVKTYPSTIALLLQEKDFVQISRASEKVSFDLLLNLWRNCLPRFDWVKSNSICGCRDL